MSEDNRTMRCSQCGAENYSWRSRCQNCNTLLHEEDKVTLKFYKHAPIIVIASISGVIGAAVMTFFTWLVMAFATGRISNIIDWFAIILTGLFVIGSVVIARKWPLPGGILLIVEGLLPLGFTMWSVILMPSVFDFLLFLSLIPGIPSIASGIMFLYASKER